MNNIPEHAQKVFQGIIYDVFQWEQEMFDGSTATFEYLSRKNSAGVIAIMPDNKICITREEQPGKMPFLSVPGGRVDEGENELEAAKRELQEETGLTSDNWSLFRCYDHGGKIDHQEHIFVARNCTKSHETQLDAGGEKIQVSFLEWDDFIEAVTNPEFRSHQLALEILRCIHNGNEEVIKKEVFS